MGNRREATSVVTSTLTATDYPKSARGYPNSTGRPNSVTYCPNSSISCPKTKAPIQEKTNHC
ncbi:hypothetical protein J1N35_038351 [Gossypium stocksii]|uniref:Uncharacterized protein n=1 Tax=Gossypium stocksii TaxID=47602 RepID=A0A9D3ZMM3_9ROSI|nr:hypothetical protein J1N35_038351 [Gossypium stocksii]